MSLATESGLAPVALPKITDDRGSLGFVEAGQHLPFQPRRVFYLYDIAQDAHRGGHAHRVQHQFLIMLVGCCRVTIDDGRRRQDVFLENPSQGLHVPPMLWLDLNDFSPNAVCLVLSSDVYDESDYIRDLEQFRRLVTP